MYMKTPMMFGRPMKKVKEYPHFVLFIDEKTGARECFQYWDLTHEIINGKSFMYTESGDLIETSDQKVDLPYIDKPRPKKEVKNDTRLKNIIDEWWQDLI